MPGSTNQLINESTTCTWPGTDALMQAYHDTEWGTPLYDDRKIFEFMVLDAFQAGLSWKTILHRREGFRAAFSDFDPQKVATYGEDDFNRLMADERIIRNRAKIRGTITNAQAFLRLQKQHGTFSAYIWHFTNGRPLINQHQSMKDVPATSPESDAMSRALKAEGFKFVGSTICYAFMQAAGLINDHLVTCQRWKAVQGM